METLDEAICTITRRIWTSVLGLDVEPKAHRRAREPNRTTVTGWVNITGAWEGAVALHCSLELARRAATIVLDRESSLAADAARDVIAELTNMTGGNLKAIMPEPSRLSLPVAVEAIDYVVHLPHSEMIGCVPFECLGESFLVSCFER